MTGMTTVTNRLATLALVGPLLTPVVTQASEASPRDQVIAAQQREVMLRMADFGTRIEECQALARRMPPRLDIAALSLPREALVNAIGHLSFRNKELCDQKERLALAYALGSQAFVREQYGLGDAPLTQDLLMEAIYSSPRRHEMALAYTGLPEQAKEYLEQTLGQTPFNLSAALDQIRTATESATDGSQ